jgi:glucose 1-dehydrogenase
MDPFLQGKKALVTGGASGIGRAITLELGNAGVEVAIADKAAADAVVSELGRRGVTGHHVLVDVSTEAGVRQMVNQALEALGAIDLFVNCAAGFWPESVTRLSSEHWYRTLDTNLSACVWAAREVARHMIPREAGSILIVGSTVVVAPSYWGAAYRVSKAGLKAYMETLAIELAPFGIRVNMLTPGAFDTPLVAAMSPAQRAAVRSEVPFGRREAQPDEIAAAATFLLSDHLSSYTTGANLVVDGGLSLRPFQIGDDDAVRAINSLA